MYRRLARHHVTPPDTSLCTAAWHVTVYRRLAPQRVLVGRYKEKEWNCYPGLVPDGMTY